MDNLFNLQNDEIYEQRDRRMLKYDGFILKEHHDSLKEERLLNELVAKQELDEQAKQEILIILTNAYNKNRAVTIEVFEKANLKDYLLVTNIDDWRLRRYEDKGNVVTYEYVVPVFFDLTNGYIIQTTVMLNTIQKFRIAMIGIKK